jgi:hypothetical protein
MELFEKVVRKATELANYTCKNEDEKHDNYQNNN